MTRKILLLLHITVLLRLTPSHGQSSAGTLDIVSWNIEFFGAAYNSGPPDKDLQEANVKSILSWLNADLYGLIEVVDTMRLRRVVDFLGNQEYGFVVAPYCSGNTSGTGNGWLSGQKQAYIYRKSIFTNVTTRGMQRNSTTAYTNWASGRFPYLFSATATINGISRNMNFMLLHGKAGNTEADYLKRAGAAIELKDTLDAFFPSTLNLIIGDFNDALHTSIYTGASVSSYYSIVSDSTDADHYRSITLPLGVAGQSSMINFPNVIDNHVISNEVYPYYIRNSARVRTDVVSIVPDYVSAHNTSDHYPVFSQYNLAGVVTGIQPVSPQQMGIRISPNPFSDHIMLTAYRPQHRLQVRLYSTDGKLLVETTRSFLQQGSLLDIPVKPLATGMYLLEISTPKERTAIKLIHQQP
jgi:hypothetical protein